MIFVLAMAAALASEPVSPPEAAAVQPVTLPTLVERLLPAEGAGRLSAGEINAPVVWLEPSGQGQMVGLARVTVGGRTSTVQDNGTRELAWSVTVGPSVIKVEPGTPQLYCFGNAYTGCSFTAAEAFAGSSLSLRQVCTDDFGGFSQVTVFEASGEGRRAFVRHTVSSDTGGANAWLEISLTQLPCEI